MNPVDLSYGPPAPKGVTTLMSVGSLDDVLSPMSHDQAMVTGAWLGVGAWVLGLLTGSSRLAAAGAGAAVALTAVRMAK